MADVTRHVLQEFAYSTRHRDYELDDPRNVALVARKFLATQAPVVDDFRVVYPYVSDDLERLQFRSAERGTPEDWAHTTRVPLEAYEYLVNAEAVAKTTGVYRDFERHMVDVGTPAHDTPLLFFLHGARNKNLEELIAQRYPQYTERQVQSLYHHIKAFRAHAMDDPHQVARDVGLLIANMPLPRIETLGEIFIPTHDKPTTVVQPIETQTQPSPMVLANTARESAKHQMRLAENPILAEYRRKSGLPLHFSPDKVLRQILVSCLVSPEHQVRVASSVMGKRQQQLSTLSVGDMTPADWQHLLNVATANLDRDTIMANTQVRDFYTALKKSMPRTELEAMTHADLVQHLVTAYMPNYQALWPETTKEMQKAIAGFIERHPRVDDQVLHALIN